MELLIILGMFSALVGISLYNRSLKSNENEKIGSKDEKDLYDVSFYLDNGELFKQYHNVEVTHWDDNIYFFKNETVDDKIHKSENITMIRTRIDKI